MTQLHLEFVARPSKGLLAMRWASVAMVALSVGSAVVTWNAHSELMELERQLQTVNDSLARKRTTLRQMLPTVEFQKSAVTSAQAAQYPLQNALEQLYSAPTVGAELRHLGFIAEGGLTAKVVFSEPSAWVSYRQALELAGQHSDVGRWAVISLEPSQQSTNLSGQPVLNLPPPPPLSGTGMPSLILPPATAATVDTALAPRTFVVTLGFVRGSKKSETLLRPAR